MERRLAEAANACRTRRTRGETGLRRFFWLSFAWPALAPVVLALRLPTDAFFGAAASLDEVDFGAAALAAGFGDTGVEEGDGEGGDAAVDDADWPPAECNKPVAGTNSVPAKNQTAKRSTQPYLQLEIGTHNLQIVFCETSYHFMLKVIPRSCNRIAVTLLVRRPALLDRIFQAVVKIVLASAF